MINKILITGADFNNKGAQSMLFTTVDEVRKRFPDATILFQSSNNLDLSNYRFERVSILWALMGNSGKCRKRRVVWFAKECIRCLIKRGKTPLHVLTASRQIKDVDLILDISGFNIGEKWSRAHNENFILKIQYAHDHGIPFYMMPQSIGPFHFEHSMSAADAESLKCGFRRVLNYPEIIFAREMDGVECLKELGISCNVVRSSDLVLQSKGIDYNNIFYDTPKLDLIDLNTEGNLAFVPNRQCLRHGDEHVTIELYRSAILHMLESGKNVYIVCHSKDDKDLCEALYQMFDNLKLHLVSKDLSCLEYDYLIKQFDYVVGSRYHGLVHALRNCVPCIALGWAVKYRELMELVGLDDYVFDIAADSSRKNMLNAIDEMSRNLETNRKQIREKLDIIQRDNCFSFLDELQEKL